MATALYGREAYGGVTLSDGLDVTTANFGATQVNKLGTGGSIKWQASTMFGGAFVVEYTNAPNNVASTRLPFINSSNNISVALDFACPALPTGTGTDALTGLVQLRAGTTTIGFVRLNGTGGIETVINTANIPNINSTLVPGNLYRLEITVAGSPTVATGTITVRVYNYGAAVDNYIGQATSNTANLGTAAFTHIDTGQLGGGGVGTSVSRTVDMGNIRLTDGSTSFQGPFVASAQPLTATISVSPSSGNAPLIVNATAGKSGGTGTTVTYAFDWGDGSSTAPQASPNASHSYTTAGTYTVTATVTSS